MKNKKTHRIGIGLLLLPVLSARIVRAEIRLPKLISDHAVFQRQVPIHLWGWTSPGEHITLAFHAQTRTAQANDFGEWSVWLEPEEAGGPYTLKLSGDAPHESSLTVSDLLVGDVWVASGQSNMEMPLRGFPDSAVLKNAEQEIASANLPRVRLLRVDRIASDVPANDIPNTWTSSTPETAAAFSAVAFLFGRQIGHDEKIPIGLIDSTWGGTPISSWISLEALGANASFMPVFAERAQFAAEQSRVAQVTAAEKREDAAAKAANQPLPKHPWHPEQASWTPALLYNGMIAPLVPYSIKGFLWYQGESDSSPERGPMYAALFPAMISDWRAQWNQGELPFLFVQISSFESAGEQWGVIRDAQRRALSTVNTAMAVSIDVGEAHNVHPADKQTVAARLALAARANVYHDTNAEFTGPVLRQATIEMGAVRVWFDHAAGGLRADRAPAGSAVTPETYKSAFEVAGEDHRFVPAQARIEGQTVVVSSSALPRPRFVRYAWSNEAGGGLYNQAGLPASTFTSE
ncbi:MAG: sialate O-acetylesterase [Acidobacteriota bacterium]|nr:sialate O-acetylesterase [Acidobacteriota bacterium]